MAERRKPLLVTSALPALVIVAALAAPDAAALAQDAVLPAPAPAPAQRPVAGPPDGMIAPGPRPAPAPLPTPTPSPAPAPTPAPAPQPEAPGAGAGGEPRSAGSGAAPAAGASPGAAPREGSRTQGPRRGAAGPSAQPGAAVAAESATDAQVVAPAPAESTDMAVPGPAPATDTALSEDAAGDDAAAPAGTRLPWLWIMLAGAMALLVAGWWLRGRGTMRRRLAADTDAGLEPAPVPASGAFQDAARVQRPAPPGTDKQPATPRSKASPRPAATPSSNLALAVTPLSATATLINLRLRYAVEVENKGTAAIELHSLRLRLFTGSDANEALLRGWMENGDGETPELLATEVAGGASWRQEGEIVMPLAEVRGMQINGRVVLLPVLAAALSLRHAHGVGALARSFVIGREGGRDGKLAPLRFDIGPKGTKPIAARDTGIGLAL